jgi:hypothetical protein
MVHVPSHQGDQWNGYADVLAKAGMNKRPAGTRYDVVPDMWYAYKHATDQDHDPRATLTSVTKTLIPGDIVKYIVKERRTIALANVASRWNISETMLSTLLSMQLRKLTPGHNVMSIASSLLSQSISYVRHFLRSYVRPHYVLLVLYHHINTFFRAYFHSVIPYNWWRS